MRIRTVIGSSDGTVHRSVWDTATDQELAEAKALLRAEKLSHLTLDSDRGWVFFPANGISFIRLEVDQ